MSTSLRERRKKQCRERILKVSRRLFKSKGYEQTMITDVAEMAEISKATFYNYFPNKESLLQGIADEEITLLRQYVARELAGETDADVKIRRVMELLILDVMSYLPVARRITFLETETDAEHPSFVFRHRLDQLLAGLVSEAQGQGVYRQDVPTADIVDLVNGVFYVAQFRWGDLLSHRGEAHCKQRIAAMLDQVLAGVKADGQ